jgi:hypothetical protein
MVDMHGLADTILSQVGESTEVEPNASTKIVLINAMTSWGLRPRQREVAARLIWLKPNKLHALLILLVLCL